MGFKIVSTKTKADDVLTKPYVKPVALYFDVEKYDTVKKCKLAYKTLYKQIGIPARLDNDDQWSVDEETSEHVFQLCSMFAEPKS
jgi:hypothetical protein